MGHNYFIPNNFTLAPQQPKTGKRYSLPVDSKRTVMQSDDVSTASQLQGKWTQHKTPQIYNFKCRPEVIVCECISVTKKDVLVNCPFSL